VVAIGLIALPSMLKHRYDKALASGVICAGGGLGVIIPPSIMLIVYGPVAGLSVAKLFFASMLPGVVLSLIYIAYILITCYLDPSKGPSISPEERARWNRRDVIAMVAKSAFPPAALIFLVLGAIFFGVAAPTEAAALGSLGALFVIALYRRLTLRGVIEAGYSALKISTFIMFLVLGAKYFMTTFSKLGGGHVIYNFLMSVSAGKTMLLIIMLFIIFILGMFMDWIGILLVVVPIYVPIVKAMGWNPLWFAIMFCITLQISYITPPFAYSIFYLKGIAPPEVKLIDIYKGCVPFILLQFIGLVILYFWPDLCLYLPSMMK
ncbi:MAG: C4-dicarboxylate ABC transporter, partial [Deltaproteobacteria bacterium]